MVAVLAPPAPAPAVAARFPARVPRPAAPELAVVIPTLNESGNVAALLDDLDGALAGLAWEAVFVDDGSTDGTPAIVAAEARGRGNVRLIRRVGRRGLASAVVEGMLATTAPVVAVLDADRQHDERVLPDLYRAVAEGGADLAVATRYAGEGSVGAWDTSRARASAAATAVARRLVPAVSDPMSGFFAIRHDRLVEVAPRLSAIGFKILLDIILSSRADLSVAEVPYRFRTRSAGESKLDSKVVLDYGLLLVDKLTGGVITPRLVMFTGVGGLGLVVHLLVLHAALGLDGGSFAAAQGAAVAVAIAFNYVLNNRFTFADRPLRGRAFWRGLASFYVICALGAGANVWFGDLVYAAHPVWWLAGAVGAAVGAVWNYTVSSVLTWRR